MPSLECLPDRVAAGPLPADYRLMRFCVDVRPSPRGDRLSATRTYPSTRRDCSGSFQSGAVILPAFSEEARSLMELLVDLRSEQRNLLSDNACQRASLLRKRNAVG